MFFEVYGRKFVPGQIAPRSSFPRVPPGVAQVGRPCPQRRFRGGMRPGAGPGTSGYFPRTVSVSGGALYVAFMTKFSEMFAITDSCCFSTGFTFGIAFNVM